MQIGTRRRPANRKAISGSTSKACRAGIAAALDPAQLALHVEPARAKPEGAGVASIAGRNSAAGPGHAPSACPGLATPNSRVIDSYCDHSLHIEPGIGCRRWDRRQDQGPMHESRKRRRGRARRPAGRATTSRRAADAPFELEMPRLQRNTLNEEVYEQLKQALMTGRIAPGATMTIRSLAASFGISPMPVREALRRLVAEHVLFLLPNRSVSHAGHHSRAFPGDHAHPHLFGGPRGGGGDAADRQPARDPTASRRSTKRWKCARTRTKTAGLSGEEPGVAFQPL